MPTHFSEHRETMSLWVQRKSSASQSRLQLNPRWAVLLCMPSGTSCNVTSPLPELYGLPVLLQVSLRVLVILYKVLHDIEPSFLRKQLCPIPSAQPVRLASSRSLQSNSTTSQDPEITLLCHTTCSLEIYPAPTLLTFNPRSGTFSQILGWEGWGPLSEVFCLCFCRVSRSHLFLKKKLYCVFIVYCTVSCPGSVWNQVGFN